MADITNPNSIAFVNTQIRPLCERARALMAEISAMNIDWQSGINATFPSDSSVVQDGRDAEGVSRLSGLSVQQAVSSLLAMAAAANVQIIAYPCVRPLDAQ